jgi:hypothetical protein
MAVFTQLPLERGGVSAKWFSGNCRAGPRECALGVGLVVDLAMHTCNLREHSFVA